MSSVNIDGHDYKRCMLCGEWTDYKDLMYIPPTREYNKEEDDRLYAASRLQDHKGEAVDKYIKAQHEWFGMDVCPACAIQHKESYRAPTITINLKG